ncbi:MAG: hypothetical protein Q9169_004646 [Polycauliona sp. 2 TL-2023]
MHLPQTILFLHHLLTLIHASPLLPSPIHSLAIIPNPPLSPTPQHLTVPAQPPSRNATAFSPTGNVGANPPAYPVPLDPRHPSGPHITIYLHEGTHALAPQEAEACLVAMNNLVSTIIQQRGVDAVIPEATYPLFTSPPAAKGTYISITTGGGGGTHQEAPMRWSTLGLALKGVYNLTIRPPASAVEVTFAIRYVK